MITTKKNLLSFLILTLIFTTTVFSVDRHKFKKCSDISFCSRHRAFTKGLLQYRIIPGSLGIVDGSFKGRIHEAKTNTFYSLELVRYRNNIVRLLVDEEEPLYERYRVKDALLETIGKEEWGEFDAGENVLYLDKEHKVVVDLEEVRLDFYVKEQVAISVNSKGLFYYEYGREKGTGEKSCGVDGNCGTDGEVPGIDPVNIGRASSKVHVDVPGINMDKAWEQSFGGSTDRPAKGPQSVGVDITFTASQIYGLPEHTTKFALQNTIGSSTVYDEPYRLYNLDVFEYELDTPMSLYGAIPWIMAHQHNLTTGVLWLNGAETWIDVEHQQGSVTSGLLDSIWGGSANEPIHPITTHWFSETGIIDVFFVFGPRPRDVWYQLSSLVGTQELPPIFSIGYHQCRWNYNDEKDVADVNAKFEELDIPYDVIWLDIEHTNGKRYFTWDTKHFPTPKDMINGIAKYGRKMVTIVDPHIKRDSGYHVHSKAEADGVYINDEHGKDYEGFCWPGSSSWIDFMSPQIRDWWAQQFHYSRYDSTPDLYTWNDMNEPSVFSGPEVTMEKSAKHFDGWEHRDVHNVYGMLMHRATSEGLVNRNEKKK
jgi:alpha 1,3-glucosidase